MGQIWFVRAGKDSVYAEDFIQRKFVAIGWPELGEIDSSISKDKLLQLYQQSYPNEPEGRAKVSVKSIEYRDHPTWTCRNP